MSWDKNTVRTSLLDGVKGTLDVLEEPYTLEVIADEVYELRRLQYRDRVVLGYVELCEDCDFDDLIVSEEYSLKDEPKDWQAIRYWEEI